MDLEDILYSSNEHGELNNQEYKVCCDVFKSGEPEIKDPIVTVIMPVYNNKEDVLNSINSLYKQTYNSWELIIIDDFSEDGTYELLKDFITKKNDGRIRLYQNKKNMGCYVCMNEGLNKAKGEYITRLDSDDYFSPVKLEKQANYLDKYQDMIAINCILNRENLYERFGEVTLMYRKKVKDVIGYYDSVRFAADSEFSDRMSKTYDGKIGEINEILYFAKNRKGSLKTSKNSGNYIIRDKYKYKYQMWHYGKEKLYISYPLNKRPFKVDEIMLP